MSGLSILAQRGGRKFVDGIDPRSSIARTRQATFVRRLHVHVSVAGRHDVQIIDDV